MDIKDFELNEAERDGRWFRTIDFHTGGETETGRVRVAHIDQEDYQAAMALVADETVNASLQRKGRRKGFSSERALEAQIGAMAQHIFVGLEDLNQGGKPLANDEPTRRRLLEIPRFREMVLGFAEDSAAYREAELGNSASSPGNISHLPARTEGRDGTG